MITKLKKFVATLNKERRNNNNFLYSQIIKNERTKRKITLEEMSKGICSISYLCKFEKNDIVADESYIKAIFDRVDLDYDLVGRNILKNGVNNVLKAYLADDLEEIAEIYDSIDNSIFNAQNYLVKAFYYLVNEKYSDFNECIQALDNIKETLPLDDVGILFFLVSSYYLKTNQPSEANIILREIQHMMFSVDEINWLLYENNFLVAFEIINFTDMYYYYVLIENIVSLGYPKIRKMLFRLRLLFSKSKNNYKRVEREITQINYKNIKQQYRLEFNYWKLLTEFNSSQYLNIYNEIIERKLYFDIKFMNLLLLVTSYIKDLEYTNRIIDLINDYEVNTTNNQEKIFYKFITLYLTTNNKHEYIEYIKENIVQHRKKYYHFLYTPFALKKYIEFLRKSSRYKEAFLLLNDFCVETKILIH